jgi:hypothetical protein
MRLTKDERKMLEKQREFYIRKLKEIDEDPSLIKYWACQKGINIVKLYTDNLDQVERKLGY